MKYGNKLILIFLMFSTVSMAYFIDSEELKGILGENRAVISTDGVALGKNSKALDNYKLKNIPIFDKRENIENEMKKTREETEKRKEDYDSDTKRINEIKYKLDEIRSFFGKKKENEENLKLCKESNNELKDIKKQIESKLKNDTQLSEQVKEYRVKLRNIYNYVYEKKRNKGCRKCYI